MFQVVVEVCGRAAVVVGLMVVSFYPIDIIRIDIDIYDIEYNAKDSHFCGREQKASGGPSCLASHAESRAIDVALCVSDTTRGGIRAVRLSGPRSTAPQGTDAGKFHRPKS